MEKKKIELTIQDIVSCHSSQGTYAVLLKERNGSRQLPIIIGPSEAQAILMGIKGLEAPRPLTHDLFYACLDVLEARMLRMLIYKAEKGVFHAYIFLRHGNDIIRVESRSSDAMALAVRFNCPILIYDSILESESLTARAPERAPSLDELQKALQLAIDAEDYEQAARLRDEINKLH